VPYCLDLLGTPEKPMPYLETDENIIKAFRPKSAIKK
jgi:molybdopterin adenylyltransferase